MEFTLTKNINWICTFAALIFFTMRVGADVEDDFLRYTSPSTTPSGVTRVWWTLPKIMNRGERLTICKEMVKFLNVDDVKTPKVDTAFADLVLVVFAKKEYEKTQADILACGIENTDFYINGKWYFYVTVGEYSHSARCFFLLRHFRDKSVYVSHHTCLNIPDPKEDDGSSTPLGHDPVNADKNHIDDLTKHEAAEMEFVAHFGNENSRIVWSPARNLDNKWELELVCKQVKKFQKDSVQFDEASVEVGKLQFFKADYKEMPVDVIACGVAETEVYLDGKRYLYVTKGEYDNCYFLLDRFKDRIFFPNRQVCVSDFTDLDHDQYHQLEDRFIAQFGRNNSPVTWVSNADFSNPANLTSECNRAIWILESEVIVSVAFAEKIELQFRKQAYKPRTTDIIRCKIANMYFIYMLKDKTDDCYYFLSRFQNERFYVDRYFCVVYPTAKI